MKWLLLVSMLTICVADADEILIDEKVVSGGASSQVYLQYDDGSPNWLTWGGTCRGVWFNTEDFYPGSTGFLLEFAEFWIYESSVYPWDTPDFYAEVWNGDCMGPLTLVDRRYVNGPNYIVYYSPALEVESSFWILENTEMSSGGWPSLMGDGTPPAVDHSFYSDDFFVWEPWGYGDYFIRAGGCSAMVLEHSTWGGIKTVF